MNSSSRTKHYQVGKTKTRSVSSVLEDVIKTKLNKNPNMSVNIEEELKKHGPYGHPDFPTVLVEALRLHSTKNKDYTHNENPLGNFDRVAAILNMYPTFPHTTPKGVLVTYMLKQLDALLNSIGREDALKVESLTSRVMDIGVYSFILVCMLRERTWHETK